MTGMVEVWRGVVAAWECDEMGHMNVQFYVERSLDALAGLALHMGFGPRRMDAMQMAFVPREHHIRFLSELHAGTPCYMRSGVLSVGEYRLRIYQELVRVEDDEVTTTFQLDIDYAKEPGWRAEVLSGELRARATNQLVDLPDYAAPRGMVLDPPRETPTVEEADDLGLVHAYRGVVHKEDTDLMCRMVLPSFMARISDAVPNLFHALGDLPRDPEKGVGGAALEYRLVYRVTPILGDVIVVRSGLKAQRGKATHFCHWLFHAETGECLCTSEAVGVLFDMNTRKAITPSEQAQARLAERAIESLTP